MILIMAIFDKVDYVEFEPALSLAIVLWSYPPIVQEMITNHGLMLNNTSWRDFDLDIDHGSMVDMILPNGWLEFK